MTSNTVFFGPAHVGKSTLAGYLVAKYHPDIDIGRENEKVKREIGDIYDPSLKYAYLVDRHLDERMRWPKSNKGKLGNTRYMSIDRVVINKREVALIDIPGAEHQKRERIKGMYFGEVGVFMIEIKKLLSGRLLSANNRDVIEDFLSPLFAWLSLGKRKVNLIIIASKMDEVNCSEKEYQLATSVIKDVCYKKKALKSLHIIPISIDVKTGREHNVFSKSRKMPWYKGDVFVDALDSVYQNMPKASSLENSIGVVYKRTDKENGIMLDVKNLQGILSEGDVIKVGPVLFQNRKFACITAKIKNIHLKGGDRVAEVDSGSIVSLNVGSLYMDSRHCQRNDFDFLKTTCITEPSAKMHMGNIIRFQVSPENLDSFGILETITVVWFGRLIPVKVIHTSEDEGSGYVTVEIINLYVALPINKKGHYLYRNFLLNKNSTVFIHCEVVDIGQPNSIELLNEEMGVNIGVLMQSFKNFNCISTETGLTISTTDSFIEIVQKVKRFHKSHLPENNNIFNCIAVNLNKPVCT